MEKARAKCQELGVRLVAICKERMNAEDFADNYWTAGSVYIDQELAFFKALG